jgi:glyoxylase-like metal-dependent hydrolase (beta-lactamase superfamily II)
MPSSWKVDVLLEGNWRGASSVLLQNGPESILVDTGLPHDAHQLVAALARRSLRPGDVHCVINTHFHIDHVSNNCLFPDSVIYATQESYDWCRALYADLADAVNWKERVLKYYPETYAQENADHLMVKMRNIGLRWWDVNRVGRSEQFRWIETNELPDGLEARMTGGHVPGHASLILSNGDGERFIVAGDAVMTRLDDQKVLTMPPHCRAQYESERRELLSTPAVVIPGHDKPFPNLL